MSLSSKIFGTPLSIAFASRAPYWTAFDELMSFATGEPEILQYAGTGLMAPVFATQDLATTAANKQRASFSSWDRMLDLLHRGMEQQAKTTYPKEYERYRALQGQRPGSGLTQLRAVNVLAPVAGITAGAQSLANVFRAEQQDWDNMMKLINAKLFEDARRIYPKLYAKYERHMRR